MCGDNLLLAFIIPYFFYVYKLVVYFVKNLTHSVSYTLHIHKHCEILNQLRETAEKQKKEISQLRPGNSAKFLPIEIYNGEKVAVHHRTTPIKPKQMQLK